ncbi:hypothetical protein AGDE_08585 [Angomonas deanei]|uniref:Uncharacterized protein n=1 Tax=Angomonas deanei TaxID=59799 RepID=A0A7G2CC88_9TRYP|nr:hypothetical protein AGDE_08585 [Angomonas deanei]CAD2216641.1 hypothetical protein, conserved [Angomonas deanei]|eukprot:EPY32548.1 hypothetical protein AGDE_08585 [Angomonas deanei]
MNIDWEYVFDIDRDATSKIQALNRIFASGSVHGAHLSPDAKKYFDTFFDTEFIYTCDSIFGTYFRSTYAEDDTVECYMDIANRKPNCRLARELRKLLSPKGSFFVFLESKSTPSSNFYLDLKAGWKNPPDGFSEFSEGNTTDFPLSSLVPNSYKLLGESDDFELAAAPRSMCPPFLLIPFWEPPLITRNEKSQRRTLTSLRCNPLAYFLIRMYTYINRRADLFGKEILAFYKPRYFFSYGKLAWFKTTEFIFGPNPYNYTFYAEIMEEFAHYFVKSSSLYRDLQSKALVYNLYWTQSSVCTALLLSFPDMAANKTISQPLWESRRYSCSDFSKLASIVTSLPSIKILYQYLYSEKDNLGALNFELTKNLSDDLSAVTADSILFLGYHFYRESLVALRQCVLSLSSVSNLRCVHVQNALELWLVLMNPLPSGVIDENYARRHFETYLVLVFDFFSMFANPKILGSLDERCVSLVRKCLETLDEPVIRGLFNSLKQKNTFSEHIFKMRMLNFTKEELEQLFSLESERFRKTAARFFVAIENRIIVEFNDALKKDLETCNDLVKKTFPGFEAFLDECRRPHVASVSVLDDRDDCVVEAHLMTPEERNQLLNGKRIKYTTSKQKYRFPMCDGKFVRASSAVTERVVREEIPLLVPVTKALDFFIELMMEIFYGGKIPRCERGHKLWLLKSHSYCCTNHATQKGIWECRFCEVVYGTCCAPLPVRSRGPLSISYGEVGFSCTICGFVFQPTTVVFSDEDCKLCADCASRPFVSVSTRILASYKFVAICVAIIAAYFLFRILVI